jgi:hypothetical protein
MEEVEEEEEEEEEEEKKKKKKKKKDEEEEAEENWKGCAAYQRKHGEPSHTNLMLVIAFLGF